MTELAAVVDRVAARVTPDDRERERLDAARTALVERTRAAVADLPVTAEVVLVGSTARDTWLAGDRDIDLFVRFPTTLSRPELERHGLAVGRAVLPDGHEEYAEHPYVAGEFDGFDVDLVPCYDVASATEIRSAVDRTPFHTAYLDDHLDPALTGDVRAAKRLLGAVGAYGSDLRTRGFSGYLVELLVLVHDGLAGLLRAAADWTPPVRYDPEAHGTAEGVDGPLVVIDPTDPERNVAAVCAAEQVARLQHHARDLLADPREAAFFGSEREPIGPDAVREHVERRATVPVAVVFDAPEVVEDQLYPQLRRSLGGLRDELDRRGFEPVRARTFAADRAVLFVEVAHATLPAVERHEGPPVHVREHAGGFQDTYADDPEVYGPFLDGDRYVVERPREVREATALAERRLFDVALGARVADALREGYEVLSGTEVARLADEPAFGRALAAHYEPRP
jgi:tRNA nucleotidyltransferase (CCA-adding enzyme)